MSRHLTTTDGALDVLRKQRWLPVLRNVDSADAVATARACRDAGCVTVELTFSTPGVLDAVRLLVDEGLTVGVGTVRTTEQVARAAAAGAAYVVSFCRPPGFLRAAADLGLTAISGALTPHEVAAAVDEGAEAVKLFPARLLQPAYVRDLHSVLGPIELMVTGGIAPQVADVRAWLDAGAFCVGIGGQLGTAARDGAASVRERAGLLMGMR